MLDVNNLSITVGLDRKIIDGLSFSLNDGDKLAIIGEEGNGKSTLVKAIVNKNLISSYATIEGQINTYGQTIGYLEQSLSADWNDQEVYRYFLKDNPGDEDNYELFDQFGVLNKYVASFGLRTTILEDGQTIGTLSGGEKVKLQLIKILMKDPDILILDEPTNDLDIETLSWMEKFIVACKKPIMFISHDEELLENTANAILHLEQLKRKTQSKYTFVHTGYKDYVEMRKDLIEKQTQVALKERSEDAAQMEKWRQVYNRVDHELNTISRKDPHGARLLKKKMQSVKSQEKRFERQRQDFTEIPDTEEAIYIDFGNETIPNGKVVCDVYVEKLCVGDNVLSKDLRLKIVGPEKTVIIGKNGVGKTTFIKMLYEELKNREDIKVGYMPQNYEDFFSSYGSALEYVSDNSGSKEELTKVRSFLASLKFTREEVMHDINELSGGQKAKLYLAKLMSQGCSVLILDEPTRNLSPLSNPVIREALIEYPGAIISVSHDRKFIKEVATSVYEMTQEGLRETTNFFENERTNKG